MTQGERVKEIRRALKLTLEKFGQKLGVGKTAISKIEKGERALTVQMMKAICNEYRVNFEYLKDGVGEMFAEVPQNVVDELCEQYDLDDMDRIMIQEYLKLDDDSRRVLKEYIRNVMKRAAADDQQARIDAEVESYRKELESEKGERSTASDGPVEKMA